MTALDMRREEVKAKGINGNGFGLTLGQAVKVAMFPTPNTVDANGGTRNGKGQKQLCHTVGGQLNPTWVEWLMGFPLGWTDCDVSETPSFRS